MASVNRVQILGALGSDPVTRYTPEGTAMTTISVATNSQWKDKNTGEKREETEWHRIAFFGRLAEVAGEYLKKGSSIYVEGRLRTRKWQDKETGQDRYSTEIIADSMQMLGSRPAETQSSPAKASETARSASSAAGRGRQTNAPVSGPGGESRMSTKAAAVSPEMEDIPFVDCSPERDITGRRLARRLSRRARA